MILSPITPIYDLKPPKAWDSGNTAGQMQARLTVYPSPPRPCKFVKKYFFSINLFHAHLQYALEGYTESSRRS